MNDPNRSELSAEEREVVGRPGDLVSEDPVPARTRSESVMVSVRIDRPVFDALSDIAERTGRTFSETARQALRDFVGLRVASHGGDYAERDNERRSRRASETAAVTWSDGDLVAELARYEATCRSAGMRETAWRSYVDYARRFLAWRTGDYLPRGVAGHDRPVRRGAASTIELRQQAGQYARAVQDAGREAPTVETYLRHAQFFIRWLEGDFEPGRRLRGLR